MDDEAGVEVAASGRFRARGRTALAVTCRPTAAEHMSMRRFIRAVSFGILGIGAAAAQCPGLGGIPFNCGPGGAPQFILVDGTTGARAGHAVTWPPRQLLAETGPGPPAGATPAAQLSARFADTLNVKDFAAAGNGTTDDTAAIQAAYTAAQANGGIVYWPTGTYKTSATIWVPSHTRTEFSPGAVVQPVPLASFSAISSVPGV
jgi:hypothetical protein